MNEITVLTDEQIASLLDDVLRASGSSLSNYTMRMGIDRMKGSVRAIEQAVLQSPEVQALIEALQEIAKYPATRDEEISMNSARATARHALNKIGKP